MQRLQCEMLGARGDGGGGEGGLERECKRSVVRMCPEGKMAGVDRAMTIRVRSVLEPDTETYAGGE